MCVLLLCMCACVCMCRPPPSARTAASPAGLLLELLGSLLAGSPPDLRQVGGWLWLWVV